MKIALLAETKIKLKV